MAREDAEKGNEETPSNTVLSRTAGDGVVENCRIGEDDVYVPEYCLDSVWRHAEIES